MKKRPHLTAAVAFGLLFAAATVVRVAPWQADGVGAGGVEETVADDRVRRFWALHREAGRQRIAGSYDEAIRLYEAALRLDERHEDALYYLGNMYLEVERVEDAAHTLAQLVRLHPTSARGHSRLGDVHLCYPGTDLFDTTRARTAYHRAAALNREETGPLVRLAQVALVNERLDEARAALEAVLGTNAHSIEGHFLLGYVAWQQGDARAAERLYGQARVLAHGEAPKEQVIGEGDRKAGAAIKPGEQLTCPAMLRLLQQVSVADGRGAGPQPAREAYREVDAALADLRSVGEK